MLEWKEIEAALSVVGAELKSPATLVVIGSSISMHLGQNARMTMDIDVWRRSSCLDVADMRQACEKAGIDFDPRGMTDPGRLYIQLIDPGVVQLGEFSEIEDMFTTGKLRVRRPPIENIIASKLVRGEGRDYDDAVYLMAHCRIGEKAILEAINTIKDDVARETATENMTLLYVYLSAQPEVARKPTTRNGTRP